MSKITKDSLISSSLDRIDYNDMFSISLPTKTNVDHVILVKTFFSSFPFNFNFLLIVRDFVAKMFGLKMGNRKGKEIQLERFTGNIGERIALFVVLEKDEKEMVTGENDKHLDFRLSYIINTLEEEIVISLATVIKFNGILGRLYFLPVGPIHRLYMPLIMKRMRKKIVLDHIKMN